MKRISILIVLFSLFFAQVSKAQCTIFPNAVELPLTLNDVQTFTPMGVVYNPNFDVYYVMSGGNPSEVAYTYDANGVLLNTVTENLDYRGCWWNPNTNQMENNTYSSMGIYSQNLDGNGWLTPTFTTIFPTNPAPFYQSMAQYDYINNYIIYYYNGSYYQYDRATDVLVNTIPITGLPVPTSDLIEFAAFYTGCPGQAYGVYDFVNRRFYFINETTGAYTATSQLPADAPTMNFYGASYTNGVLWLCDNASIFHGFQVLQPCSVVATITPPKATYNICSGDFFSMEANAGPNLTYQWQLNGTNIAGATDIAYVAAAGGVYNVVVSNSCSAVSDSDTLVINPAPVALITANGATTICQGDSVQIATTNDQDVIIQWYKNGTIIPGATTNLFYASTAGIYDIIKTSIYGCADTSAGAVITIVPLPVPQIAVSGNTLTVTNGPYNSYQWYRNGIIINGAIASSYTTLLGGAFTVSVVNSHGCVGISQEAWKYTTGVQNVASANVSLNIYPNPTNGVLTINMESGDNIHDVHIKVANIMGQEIMQKDFPEVAKKNFTESIDLKGQAAGVYMIELNVDGTITENKIVLQ